MNRPLQILTVLWLSMAALAYAAIERGVALKADSIKSEPFQDAGAVGDLKKGDSVQIVSKKGGWLQIKAPSGSGWVRMLSVKRGTGGGSSAAGELGGVAAMSTGRAGHWTDHVGDRCARTERGRSEGGEVRCRGACARASQCRIRSAAVAFASAGKLAPSKGGVPCPSRGRPRPTKRRAQGGSDEQTHATHRRIALGAARWSARCTQAISRIRFARRSIPH